MSSKKSRFASILAVGLTSALTFAFAGMDGAAQADDADAPIAQQALGSARNPGPTGGSNTSRGSNMSPGRGPGSGTTGGSGARSPGQKPPSPTPTPTPSPAPGSPGMPGTPGTPGAPGAPGGH
jgi:collagen type III alpha